MDTQFLSNLEEMEEREGEMNGRLLKGHRLMDYHDNDDDDDEDDDDQ